MENVAPSITKVSPAAVGAGSGTITVTVTGSNFAPNAQILWNGLPLPTQFVSAGEVKGQINADLLANGQIVGMIVENPQPNGRLSQVVASR